MLTIFVALYRGQTFDNAALLAITSDPTVVAEVAASLVHQSTHPLAEHLLVPTDLGGGRTDTQQSVGREGPSTDTCLNYSVGEARVALGVGRTLMYRLIREGTIPSVRYGRRLMIPRSAIKESQLVPLSGAGEGGAL